MKAIVPWPERNGQSRINGEVSEILEALHCPEGDIDAGIKKEIMFGKPQEGLHEYEESTGGAKKSVAAPKKFLRLEQNGRHMANQELPSRERRGMAWEGTVPTTSCPGGKRPYGFRKKAYSFPGKGNQ